MSAPQWKPGDVALVSSWRGTDQIGIRVTPRNEEDPLVWCVFDGEDTRGLSDDEVTDARPLVVIDAEDREQVGRVIRAIKREGYATQSTDAMQAALRSLVTDPKPDEPQGLGAVVEDEQGNHWIRHGAGARPWMLAGASPSNRDTYAYATLPATRVLSEGWRA